MASTETLDSGPLADAVRSNVVLEEESFVVEEAFIVGDDNDLVSANDVLKLALKTTMESVDPNRVHREVSGVRSKVAKAIEGSNQSNLELGDSSLSNIEVVEPPYPPELLATFLEVDETHFRCVVTKSIDSVGREYEIVPTVNIKSEEDVDSSGDGSEDSDPASKKIPSRSNPTQTSVSLDEIAAEVAAVSNFIDECNEVHQFEGVLQKACMDYESVGWGAIEVIRSRDRRIRKIAHVPASRIRVLRNWRGYIEIVDTNKHVYYQPFGQKVYSKIPESVISGKDKTRPYNPRIDGPLTTDNTTWNLINRDTGRKTSSLAKSANELIWVPKLHPNTIYYGYTDVIPALGFLLSKVHIRDYILQFFEHNTIPRYAIVIEGAKLAEPVKKAITEYFSTHVKGKAHKTLIIPIPSIRGEVKIRFEKLSSDEHEGSFQETRKNDSQGIMVSHGVSPAIIGVQEAASLGSGKGLSQAEIYKDRIVTPGQSRWGAVLTRLFKLGLGVRHVKLKFNPLDIRDREAEMRMYTGYRDRGVMTINQIRKLARLGDPVPGGDRPFIASSQGMIFIDEILAAVSNPGALQSAKDVADGKKADEARITAAQNNEKEGVDDKDKEPQ